MMNNELKQTVELYLKECENKGYSESTLKAYRLDLAVFASWLEERTICKRSIYQYLQFTKENFSKRTYNRRLVSIRNYLKFLDMDTNFNHQSEKVDFKKDTSREEDIEHMIGCMKQSNMPIRNKIMISLIYTTGLKISEICSVKSSDIDFQKGNMTVTEKKRIIALNPYTLDLMEKYSKIKEPNTYFFSGRDGGKLSEQRITMILKDFCINIGIEPITPTMLRNHFAFQSVKENMGIDSMYNYLGIRDLQKYY